MSAVVAAELALADALELAAVLELAAELAAELALAAELDEPPPQAAKPRHAVVRQNTARSAAIRVLIRFVLFIVAPSLSLP